MNFYCMDEEKVIANEWFKNLQTQTLRAEQFGNFGSIANRLKGRTYYKGGADKELESYPFLIRPLPFVGA